MPHQLGRESWAERMDRWSIVAAQTAGHGVERTVRLRNVSRSPQQEDQESQQRSQQHSKQRRTRGAQQVWVLHTIGQRVLQVGPS